MEDEDKNKKQNVKTLYSNIFRWYVVHVLTGYEEKVKNSLLKKIQDCSMNDYFSEISIVRSNDESNVDLKFSKRKKKVVLGKNYFPGYVLLKMILNEKTWHLVKNTDKVMGFVGSSKSTPVPISEEEALYLANQVVEGFKKSKISLNFSEGDVVRVVEGPFSTFTGVIESVSDKGKVKVQVSIFGRPTPVELDYSQVEKI